MRKPSFKVGDLVLPSVYFPRRIKLNHPEKPRKILQMKRIKGLFKYTITTGGDKPVRVTVGASELERTK